MTREEADFIGALNMCDEISNEAYKKIMCHCEEEEPCEDAISRQAVLDAMYELCDTGETLNENPWRDNPHIDAIADAINNLPPVTPQPKTGHWIEKEGWDGDVYYECSVCEEPFCLIDGTPTDNMYNFCPNCGAKMVEPQESEDCRNCKKWEDCPCGKEGHESGTSYGYSIGECKDFEPQESEVEV